MEIALVFPRYKYPSGDIPLGVGYISSYIKKNTNCRVDIIDTTFNNSDDYVLKKIIKKDYKLVCFSVMTTMLKDALRLASAIKKLKPKLKIIFAGPHPTVMPSETIQEDCVDAVIVGEGEETILEIVKNKFKFDMNTDGLWYKEDGMVIVNKYRKPIDNLDRLPFPKRFNVEQYMKYWFSMDSVGKFRGLNIIAARGCPYQCTYCQPTLEKLFGRKVRKRSAKNIVDELEYLKKKYNINAFVFQDDTFIFDKRWATEVCDELIRRKLDLSWSGNVRANLVDEDIMLNMKDAGMKKVLMGVESGSQRVLDEVYHKGITLKQVEDSVSIFKRLGLKVQCYFMIGAPTETEDEIDQTIRFATKLPIDEATFSITTPLPYTYLYDKIKDKINKDVTEFDYYKTLVYKHELTEKRLNYLKRKALLSFYLAPNRFFKTMWQLISPTQLRHSLAKLKRF